MNKQEIRELMRFFDKSNISKVKIKDGDFVIELQKGFENAPVMTPPATQYMPSAPIIQSSTEKVKQDVKSSTDAIKSPMVGTFYSAPSPGSEAFVKVGSIIKKGQTVGIIEAMKIMNEIEAEFDCRITELLVEDGEPVEFDMSLFGVEKV